jgi:hypothetical protein
VEHLFCMGGPKHCDFVKVKWPFPPHMFFKQLEQPKLVSWTKNVALDSVAYTTIKYRLEEVKWSNKGNDYGVFLYVHTSVPANEMLVMFENSILEYYELRDANHYKIFAEWFKSWKFIDNF